MEKRRRTYDLDAVKEALGSVEILAMTPQPCGTQPRSALAGTG
jgi:hypothetical protein